MSSRFIYCVTCARIFSFKTKSLYFLFFLAYKYVQWFQLIIIKNNDNFLFFSQINPHTSGISLFTHHHHNKALLPTPCSLLYLLGSDSYLTTLLKLFPWIVLESSWINIKFFPQKNRICYHKIYSWEIYLYCLVYIFFQIGSSACSLLFTFFEFSIVFVEELLQSRSKLCIL